MRKIILPLLVALSFTSCDKVSKEEYLQQLDTLGSSGSVTIRKILLEDYTGHKCGNCPAAAEQAQYLKGVYGDRLVVMGVHAGFFAKASSTGKYTLKLSDTVSEELDTFFGNSEAGNPNGMVNRAGYLDDLHIQGVGNWSTAVALEMVKPVIASLDIENTYSSSSRMLQMSVFTEFLTSYNSGVKLAIYLVEDSITGWQTDYSKPPGQQDIENYVHRHVLRKAVNSTFGTDLTEAATYYNNRETFEKQYAYYIPQSWNAAHCSIVAILYDAVTYEVLQVEEKHIQ